MLARENASDPYIFYMYAEYYFHTFKRSLRQRPGAYAQLFFENFIDRYKFDSGLDKASWEKAILLYRKSLALGAEEAPRARERLAALYLWGGSSYWPSGQRLAKKIKNQGQEADVELLYLLSDREPAWQVIEKQHYQQLVNFYKGLHYLKKGNEPRGFSELKTISEIDTSGSEKLKALKNNVIFILSQVMAKRKKSSAQLALLEELDLNEFLPRNTWFLQQYHVLLRFYGKKQEASSLLFKYEKKINEEIAKGQ